MRDPFDPEQLRLSDEQIAQFPPGDPDDEIPDPEPEERLTGEALEDFTSSMENSD